MDDKPQTIQQWLYANLIRKLGEKSTWLGIFLLVVSISQNPQVFEGLVNVYNAFKTGSGTTAIVAAVASVLLIVVREYRKPRAS